jgi:hypothetical protein
MYRFLILTLFTCLSYQVDEVTITWSEDLKLQWSDFKGEPKSVGDAVAITASGISFQFSTTKSSSGLVDYSFSITAHFYPDKSWHVNGLLSDKILDHERLHFDITELYARKFRQRVSNTTFTNAINSEMEHINNAINVELAAMQKKYDAETNHSQNTEKQIAWQNFIVVELNKLSNYGG